jgi:hypothetical protein
MYSALLLIFVWFAIVEEFLLTTEGKSKRNILIVGIAAAVLFSAGMDAAGRHYLADRDRELVAGMSAFEHSTSTAYQIGPVLRSSSQAIWMEKVEREAPDILKTSIRLGIYKPPS